MTMKSIIDQTTFNYMAEELGTLMDNAGLTVKDVPNLPRHMGMKVRGISTYQLQSQMMEVITSGVPVQAHSDVTEASLEEHDFEVLFGTRIYLALTEAGFNSIDDLHGKDVSDLSQINGIGRASANKIVAAVNEQGENDG